MTFSSVCSAFERSLVRMNKMPRIWNLYLSHLSSSPGKVTATRRAFDRALQSLPATQHEKIWKDYVSWSLGCGVTSTASRVQRRYLAFDPSHAEPYGDFLSSCGDWSGAASMYARCVDDPAFVSPKGTNRHDLWMRLADVCSRHPRETGGAVDFDAVVRAALDRDGKEYQERFAEIAGVLWCKLADYYARAGEFGKAREVYEEGLVSVDRVKDFSTVFDGYSRFEENTLTAKIAMQEEEDSDDSDDDDDDEATKALPESLRELLSVPGTKGGGDVELSLARAEYLIERRPLLLNAVLLRQNPHNVGGWTRRSDMYMEMEEGGGVEMAAAALEEGCEKVDAGKAVNGFPSEMWMKLARLHEDAGDADRARGVYERVCTNR